MADKSNKYRDAVAKILKLTQDGELKWSDSPPAFTSIPIELISDDVQIRAVFYTEYLDRIFRLVHRVVKVPFADPLRPFRQADRILSEISLEIVSSRGFVLWSFPSTGIEGDLLSAVRYRVVDVDSLLNDILDGK